MSSTRSPGLPGQDRGRTSLRVLGLVLLAMAVALLSAGLADLFSALRSSSEDGAQKVWMAFVGLLMLGPAGWCLQGGFMGSATVSAGLLCGRCGAPNDEAAAVCDGCGGALAG